MTWTLIRNQDEWKPWADERCIMSEHPDRFPCQVATWLDEVHFLYGDDILPLMRQLFLNDFEARLNQGMLEELS